MWCIQLYMKIKLYNCDDEKREYNREKLLLHVLLSWNIQRKTPNQWAYSNSENMLEMRWRVLYSPAQHVVMILLNHACKDLPGPAHQLWTRQVCPRKYRSSLSWDWQDYRNKVCSIFSTRVEVPISFVINIIGSKTGGRRAGKRLPEHNKLPAKWPD